MIEEKKSWLVLSHGDLTNLVCFLQIKLDFFFIQTAEQAVIYFWLKGLIESTLGFGNWNLNAYFFPLYFLSQEENFIKVVKLKCENKNMYSKKLSTPCVRHYHYLAVYEVLYILWSVYIKKNVFWQQGIFEKLGMHFRAKFLCPLVWQYVLWS